MIDVLSRINELERELRELKSQIRDSMPRVEWCYSNNRDAGCFYKSNEDYSLAGKQRYGSRCYWRVFAIPALNVDLIASLQQVIDGATMIYTAKAKPVEDNSEN